MEILLRWYGIYRKKITPFHTATGHKKTKGDSDGTKPTAEHLLRNSIIRTDIMMMSVNIVNIQHL